MKSKTLTIRITESQYEKIISQLSLSEELTLSSIVRNLIDKSDSICRNNSVNLKSVRNQKNKLNNIKN